MLTKCPSTLSYYFPTMGLTAGKSACKTRASSDHKTAYTVVSFDGRCKFLIAYAERKTNIFTKPGACVIVHSESDCHGSYTGPYPDGSYSLGGNWPREARSFKLYPAVNGKC